MFSVQASNGRRCSLCRREPVDIVIRQDIANAPRDGSLRWHHDLRAAVTAADGPETYRHGHVGIP